MRRAILVLCLAAVACGGGDGGGGGGGGGGDGVTLAEVCQAVAEVTCDKLSECAEQNEADCVDTFVSACCSGTECDEEVAFEDEVQDCTDAMRDQSCEDFLDGVIPSQCE